MCNLDTSNGVIIEDNVTIENKIGSPCIVTKMSHEHCGYRTDSKQSIEKSIRNCRILVMTDYVRSKGRKVLLDSKYELSQQIQLTKETDGLCEMAFGNFSLSSKASEGFKIHFNKGQSEIVISKVFLISCKSALYNLRARRHRISPDSGTITCGSGTSSSYNSNVSSCVSSVSSAMSVKTVPINYKRNIPIRSTFMINSLTEDQRKNYNNEDETVSNNAILAAIVLIFKVSNDNTKDFEEYLFQYFLYFEMALNRLSKLIIDNRLIRNSNVNELFMDTFYQSLDWLITQLPLHQLTQTHDSSNLSYIKILERTIRYYGYQQRLEFLAKLLYKTMSVSPLICSKFIKLTANDSQPFYPYQKLCENIGINMDPDGMKYARIVVVGSHNSVKAPNNPPSSSWKEKFANSLFKYRSRRSRNNSNNNSSVFNFDDNNELVRSAYHSSNPVHSPQGHPLLSSAYLPIPTSARSLTPSAFNQSTKRRSSNSTSGSQNTQHTNNHSIRNIDEVELVVDLLDNLLINKMASVSVRKVLEIETIGKEMIQLVKLANKKTVLDIPLADSSSSRLQVMPQLNYRGSESYPTIISPPISLPIYPSSRKISQETTISSISASRHNPPRKIPTIPATNIKSNVLLQGYHLMDSANTSPSALNIYDQMCIEANLSQTSTGKQPDYLIINTDDDSTNLLSSHTNILSVSGSSNHSRPYNCPAISYLSQVIQKLHGLQKLDGYAEWIGELFIKQQLRSFNRKANLMHSVLVEEVKYCQDKDEWSQFYSSIFEFSKHDIELVMI